MNPIELPFPVPLFLYVYPDFYMVLFSFFWPCNLWYLSSPTSDQTYACPLSWKLCRVLTIGLPVLTTGLKSVFLLTEGLPLAFLEYESVGIHSSAF